MDTIIRLLENRIRVIKENSAVASVKITEEDWDRELLKDVDAQITVGLDPTRGVEDQKLNLPGTLRRRVAWLQVKTFTLTKEAVSADPGALMRDKVVEQIEAIIRENRTNPYTTTYNFYGLGYPYGYPHVASDAGGAADLEPTDSEWTELSAANYQKIWSNDDVLHEKSHATVGEYALLLYKFKVDANPNSVKSLVLSWVGYGSAPGGDGATIKLWNSSTSTWDEAQSGTGSSKETLTITVTSGWTDFIDDYGFLWFLAETANPATAEGPAVLYCDFVQLVFQVKGLTNCDVVSYRTFTRKEIKPFVFEADILLRGWLFEIIS